MNPPLEIESVDIIFTLDHPGTINHSVHAFDIFLIQDGVPIGKRVAQRIKFVDRRFAGATNITEPIKPVAFDRISDLKPATMATATIIMRMLTATEIEPIRLLMIPILPLPEPSVPILRAMKRWKFIW